MTPCNSNSPNLFVVGAMKSGTTSLHNYLNSHPAIFMCEPKEPGYFVEELRWRKGEQWYRSLFEEATTNHRYIGESSSYYAKLPTYQGVPQRIKLFNPESRILYVMRNPFDRIVSHYWHNVRQIYSGGQRKNIYQACMTEDKYLSYSNYAMQIRPYIDHFGPDNVLLLIFEDIAENTRTQLNSIFDWLGLKSDIQLTGLSKAWNTKPPEIVGAGAFGFLNYFSHSPTWELVSPHTPMWLKSLANKIAKKKIYFEAEIEHTEQLREEIRDELNQQIGELSTFINRDLLAIWKI